MKKGCIYLKEERNEKEKWGEKGESYEKGGEEKRLGGGHGKYGESVRGIPALILPGRQREQECGCCPS